jgi:hypothetical protein
MMGVRCGVVRELGARLGGVRARGGEGVSETRFYVNNLLFRVAGYSASRLLHTKRASTGAWARRRSRMKCAQLWCTLLPQRRHFILDHIL